MNRITVAAFAVLLSMAFSAQAALAGEWAPGLEDHNGAADHARSECVYNGHDDNDPEDDGLWEASPAGGHVQSGGQMIAIQAQGTEVPPEFEEALLPPGIQGLACNPTAGA